MIYNKKNYRLYDINERWHRSQIKFETSDLYVCAKNINGSALKKFLIDIREEIRNEEKFNADFLTSLQPLQMNDTAPEIVKSMYHSALITGTGPMAAVAGAVAEFCGKKLMQNNNEVIIENGGDIWCSLIDDAVIGVYAGGHYFKSPIGLTIKAAHTPLGICTSSGVIGTSLSFGKADAVTVIAQDAPLADAAATGACNLINDKADIKKAVDYTMSCEGVKGVLVIFKETLSAHGAVELSSL